MEQDLRRVFVASGEMHASQVRAFLEAAGIATAVRGESLRKTHGLTLDGLGAVEILVADRDVEQARSLLDAAETGQLRLGDEVDSNEDGAQ
jgi:hypothetical protein